MSATFTISDVARHFGISRSQAFRELPSWPHKRVNGETIFTSADFEAIKRMMNAGANEQLARLQVIEQRLADVRALDAAR
ncbi:hypothetical protein [Pseudarthrobacter sp. LT1]|uniref:hypothetical protein n=1 Tax=Pseudarthrobacter sp. LT1 TaxID=3111450 RepID=UPI002D79FFBD|nr:hypothetical protein [Pseudarthrobacter sp. LT1]WRT15603.1 hypothetical protein VIK36_09045 [Pseudarthrobacter sp. LT1]